MQWAGGNEMKKIMTKSLSLFLAVVMVISCITVSKPNRVNADSTAYTIMSGFAQSAKPTTIEIEMLL